MYLRINGSHRTRGLLSELSFGKQLPLFNAEREKKKEGIQATMNGRRWLKRKRGMGKKEEKGTEGKTLEESLFSAT